MLKIGVIGAGHLGKIHLKILSELTDNYELVGFFDIDKDNSIKVSHNLNIKFFQNVDDLIHACDVIDVVSPTISHFEYAQKVLKNKKHLFIEKPLTNTLEEAEKLIQIAKDKNVKVQVGHVERFNPAFTSAEPFIGEPLFIESHRLAEFNPRGTDVSVVLDLMIHDIDIILSIVKSEIKHIHASGVSVLTDTPDIANVRIEFENGCTCNLTTSRMSLKNMRKIRVFQKDAYISIDFLEKESDIIKIKNATNDDTKDPFAIIIDTGKEKKKIYFENPNVTPNNAIKDELISFSEAINSDTNTKVDIYDGYNALKVAYLIIDELNKLNKPL